MRLDKFISNHTAASRSQVRRFLKQQLVTVNGEVSLDPAFQVSPSDQVVVAGESVRATSDVYYMLNKPNGYVCSNSDSHLPTVFDLLGHDADLAGRRLQVAGRLDADTTGLVLLTSDGAWNHRVTSPRTGCDKVYAVELAEPFDPATQAEFANGMQLRGETKSTRPAQIRVIEPNKLLLTIHEGKYHQVKRMFAATENRVVALHRLSVGNLALDPTLAPGEYRALTGSEIAAAEGRGER